MKEQEQEKTQERNLATEDQSNLKQEDPQSQSPQPESLKQDKERLDEQSVKRVIEALIFASDKPLSIRQMKDIIGDIDPRLIRRLINDLKQEYEQSERSFGIIEVAGGFQFSTNPTYGRWLKKLYNIKQSDYLTTPSLETLAIIAYRQPITKTDIEFVRGVSVDGVINNLLQKGLIKIAGRKEVVGRPFVYETTGSFLQYFGLNNVEELPALPEFKEADLGLNRDVEKKTLVENTEGETDEKPKDLTQENRPD